MWERKFYRYKHRHTRWTMVAFTAWLKMCLVYSTSSEKLHYPTCATAVSCRCQKILKEKSKRSLLLQGLLQKLQWHNQLVNMSLPVFIQKEFVWCAERSLRLGRKVIKEPPPIVRSVWCMSTNKTLLLWSRKTVEMNDFN